MMIISVENARIAWSDGSSLSLPDFQVQPSERVFIQGESGCGKTSLLHVIAGLIQPCDGQVSVVQTNLRDLSERQRDAFRSQHIGVVFQQFNLLPFLTVEENILLGLHFSKRTKESRQRCFQNLDGLLVSMGLSDFRNKATHKLSVGQQQRVALCRALIGEPPVVLADEPTSALDERNAQHFMQLLLEQCSRRQSTLVFVAHDSRLASWFDRVVEISPSALKVNA